MPRHTASGPSTPIKEGSMIDTNSKAIGPPMTIPTVPVKNMIKAFGPKLKIAFKSTLKINKTKHAGSK